MAHIHLGAPAITGGIAVWLCGQQPPATPNHPTQPAVCPTTTSGDFSRTVGAANVIGPSGQGLAAGDWAALVRAMRAGATYVNVHTAAKPSGEIRGRVVVSNGD